MKQQLYGFLVTCKLLKDGAPLKFSNEIYDVGKNFIPVTRKVLKELEEDLEISPDWRIEDREVRSAVIRRLKGSRIPYFSTLPVQYCWMRAEGKNSISMKEIPEKLKEVQKASICLGNGGDLKDDSIDKDYPQESLLEKSLYETQELASNDKALEEDFKDKLGRVPINFLAYKASFGLGISKLNEIEPKAVIEVMKYKYIAEEKAGKELFLSSRIKFGRFEEAREELSSLEDILKLQGKLGAIAGGLVSSSLEIFKKDFDPLRNVLVDYFYNLTSFANFIGDDLKEFKEDFEELKGSIKNPANSLALLLVMEGEKPSLEKLKEFLKSEYGSRIFKDMLEFFLRKIEEDTEFIYARGSEVDKKLTSISLGFTFASVSNSLKSFSNKFGLPFYKEVEDRLLGIVKKLKE